MKRAVITGIGIVSSIGNNAQEVAASLKAGTSGITFSEQFAEAGLRSNVWGDLKIDLKEKLSELTIKIEKEGGFYNETSNKIEVVSKGLTVSSNYINQLNELYE